MKVLICLVVSIFSHWQSAAETYRVYTENGKVGLKDQQGHVVIPASYEALGWSVGSFSVINRVTGYKANGKWGLINLNNNQITPANFSFLKHAEGNIIEAAKKDERLLYQRFGCLNTEGEELIPFQYDGIKIIAFRAIVFSKFGSQYKYGLVDLDNKVHIPLQYDHIQSLGSLRYAVKNPSGKIALFTENGKQLTDHTFDHVSAFTKDFAIVHQQGKQGVIDRSGILLLPVKYYNITVATNGSVKARQPNEWHILDGQNKVITKVEADSLITLGSNMFGLATREKIRLVDGQFHSISPNLFDQVEPFLNGRARFRKDNKWGLVLVSGSIAVENLYEQLKWNGKNLTGLARNGSSDQWILLDTTGRRISIKGYDVIEDYNGDFFPVISHGRYGALDNAGKELIHCVFDKIERPVDGHLVVKFHGEFGIIDWAGNWVVAPQPHPVALVGKNKYLLYQKGTTFLKSFSGNVIYFTSNPLEIKDQYLYEYVSTGGRWTINLEGRIVKRQMPPQDSFETVFPESEGLRGIKKNGQYGFVDDEGRLRIANRYEGIKPFSDGLAAIKILGKWGFLSHQDRIAIQPVYDEVFPFQNGIAIVKQKGNYGLVNKAGDLMQATRYDSIHTLSSHRFLLFQNGLQGAADKEGQLIVTPKFNQILDLNNTYLIVERDGKYGLITEKGISTIPLIYDFISYDLHNDRYLALKKGDWVEVKM